ncbi:MAG TPA: VOC family protein [Anaeromyxobacteraceae bacterium]|nr:VOC family protein [Anaeromyxobacteraceae bacterium]
MKLRHVGLVCRSESVADHFYRDLLGLKKSERKEIPASLARPLFGVDSEIALFYYTGDGFQVEVFIHEAPGETPGRIAHACLEVDEYDQLLTQARTLGFKVTRLAKGTGFVSFLDDMDGNRFEIKAR